MKIIINSIWEQVPTCCQKLTEWGTPRTGDGQFINPSDIITDKAGNVYVVDSENDRIQKFDNTGKFITKWSINSPFGVAVDPNGKVYVIDQNDASVEIYSPTSP